MNDVFSKKTRLNVILCAACIMGIGSSASMAGEITGNGRWIAGDPDAPLNGKSECAYSGQQDDPIGDAGFFKGDRVQSWGQIPRFFRIFLTSIGSNPGKACNPSGG